MAHVTKEELLRATDVGRPEVERMAAHLAACPACRALAAALLEDRALPAKREAPLKTLLELAGFERETAVEQLLARAELADLSRQTRAVQKERVIRSRSCHTAAFLDLLLAAVRAPLPRDEAEFLASLAILAVQGMEEKRSSPALKNDLLATIWIDTANTRRINGEWNNARRLSARPGLSRNRHWEFLAQGEMALDHWLGPSRSGRTS